MVPHHRQTHQTVRGTGDSHLLRCRQLGPLPYAREDSPAPAHHPPGARALQQAGRSYKSAHWPAHPACRIRRHGPAHAVHLYPQPHLRAGSAVPAGACGRDTNPSAAHGRPGRSRTGTGRDGTPYKPCGLYLRRLPLLPGSLRGNSQYHERAGASEGNGVPRRWRRHRTAAGHRPIRYLLQTAHPLEHFQPGDCRRLPHWRGQ